MRATISTLAYLAALALAAPAHATVVNVASYWSFSGQDAYASPPIVTGIAADGNPLVSNWTDYGSIGPQIPGAGSRELLWWSGANGDRPWNGATPTPVVSQSAGDVSVDLTPYNPDGYPGGPAAIKDVLTFTSPSAATETLDVVSNGDAIIALNGVVILQEDANGTTYADQIGETLLAGTNTIEALYFQPSNAPVDFSFDPALPSSLAAPTPEISTFAMLALGAAGMWWFGARERGPRLATIGDSWPLVAAPLSDAGRETVRRLAGSEPLHCDSSGEAYELPRRMSRVARVALGAGTVAAVATILAAGAIATLAILATASSDHGVMDSPISFAQGRPV